MVLERVSASGRRCTNILDVVAVVGIASSYSCSSEVERILSAPASAAKYPELSGPRCSRLTASCSSSFLPCLLPPRWLRPQRHPAAGRAAVGARNAITRAVGARNCPNHCWKKVKGYAPKPHLRTPQRTQPRYRPNLRLRWPFCIEEGDCFRNREPHPTLSRKSYNCGGGAFPTTGERGAHPAPHRAAVTLKRCDGRGDNRGESSMQ